jgi:hypothetical protein
MPTMNVTGDPQWLSTLLQDWHSPHEHPFPGADRASFDDYATGRSDRLGRDLLIQISHCGSEHHRRLSSSLLVVAPLNPIELLASAGCFCPDLVWIHAECSADADLAARTLAAPDREVVVIDDGLDNAAELGLLGTAA